MPNNEVSIRSLALTVRFVACLSMVSATAVGGGRANTRGVRGVQKSLAREKSQVQGVRGAHATLANKTFTTNTDCLAWTGDTCQEGRCNPAIGPVSCTDDAYCTCAPGHCSTADGLCVANRNRLVGEKTVFKNARFAGAHLALSCSSFDLTTDRLIPEQELIDIFELAHGDGAMPNYMLVSNEDRCAASFPASPLENSVHGKGMPRELDDDSAPPNPQDLSVRLTSAPRYKGDPREHDATVQVVLVEVVAASAHGKTATLFSDGFSIGVLNLDSHQSDGGIDAGGYWVLDPPLPLQLPPYQGPSCTYDCGEHGGGHTSSLNSRWALGIIVFSLLFCFWFWVFFCIFTWFSSRASR